MYASDYFEDGVLNALKNITFTAPEQVYLALCINDPTDSGKFGEEVNYVGYARKQITFSSPTIEGNGLGFRNDSIVKFAEAPEDSATATHIKIMDSLVGGNMLLYGKLNEDKAIKAGNAPVVRVGECIYWISGDMSAAFATKVLNVLRGQPLQGFKPYITLFNGNPQTGGNELIGGNFMRMPVEFGTPGEGAGGQRIIINTAQIEMAIASSNLGSFDYDVLFDREQDGIPIYSKQTNGDIYSKGDMVFYEAGAIKVGLN